MPRNAGPVIHAGKLVCVGKQYTTWSLAFECPVSDKAALYKQSTEWFPMEGKDSDVMARIDFVMEHSETDGELPIWAVSAHLWFDGMGDDGLLPGCRRIDLVIRTVDVVARDGTQLRSLDRSTMCFVPTDTLQINRDHFRELFPEGSRVQLKFVVRVEHAQHMRTEWLVGPNAPQGQSAELKTEAGFAPAVSGCS